MSSFFFFRKSLFAKFTIQYVNQIIQDKPKNINSLTTHCHRPLDSSISFSKHIREMYKEQHKKTQKAVICSAIFTILLLFHRFNISYSTKLNCLNKLKAAHNIRNSPNKRYAFIPYHCTQLCLIFTDRWMGRTSPSLHWV